MQSSQSFSNKSVIRLIRASNNSARSLPSLIRIQQVPKAWLKKSTPNYSQKLISWVALAPVSFIRETVVLSPDLAQSRLNRHLFNNTQQRQTSRTQRWTYLAVPTTPLQWSSPRTVWCSIRSLMNQNAKVFRPLRAAFCRLSSLSRTKRSHACIETR